MNREEIKEQIIKILKENLDEYEDIIDLDEEATLNNDTGVDSMRFIYVMTKIETLFNITIPEKKWSKLISLKDVIDAVELEVNKKN